jgi:hypothetical protein
LGVASHPVRLSVVRVSEQLIGARFDDPGFEVTWAISHYFDLEIVAARLNPVRAEMLKPEPDGTPHWFQGNNNCDLFYVSSGREVLGFQLTVFGNYVEGGREKPLRFGSLFEEENDDGPRYRGATLVGRKRASDEVVVSLAERLVTGIKGLDPEHFRAILGFLRSR